MNWIDTAPECGDLIRTKVSFYYHYGIFVSEQEVIQFGLPNDPGRPADEIKVLSSDVYTFLAGGNLEVGHPTREEQKHIREPQERVSIARSRLGEGGYDILHHNCEHFVNECAFGESRSSFLDNVRVNLRRKLSRPK